MSVTQFTAQNTINVGGTTTNYFGERWVRRKMARQPSNEAGDAMFPDSVAFGLGLAFAFALSLLVFVAFGGLR